MKTYENIQETLSFYGVNCKESYYISSGDYVKLFPRKPFRMDYFAVCICTAGSIRLNINKNDYTIKKTGVLISAPTTVVRFVKSSPNFRLKLLFFDRNFLLKNISNPFIIEKLNLFLNVSYTIMHLDEVDYETSLSLLKYLQKKSTVEGIYTNDIIRSTILNLLFELAETIARKGIPTSQNHSDLSIRFADLVVQHFKEYKNVDYYTTTLCVSNKHLIEVVKKSTGKTPHQFIDEMLLKESIVLLGNTTMSITDIAFELNFQSVASFSRFFKANSGHSPTQYRKKK
ncbi:MAG: AraC family transcriptional regulator [Pseudopedobacter saltans]|uniref:AraC family transcriptional regulator n=1 Tax=Pseudopedobacter saltans TaxID=151895 RepID=A0A2W5GTE5_9SPHI|nr:MAG: AraC family transcriptional regulator [Pseudopedobacter saltans]